MENIYPWGPKSPRKPIGNYLAKGKRKNRLPTLLIYSNSNPPSILIGGHVLGQTKLLHVELKSIRPPKFGSTPSPRAVDNDLFHSPNWRCLISPPDMPKLSQASFSQLLDDSPDFKFRSSEAYMEIIPLLGFD